MTRISDAVWVDNLVVVLLLATFGLLFVFVASALWSLGIPVVRCL